MGSVVHFISTEGDFLDVQSLGVLSFASIVHVKIDVSRIMELCIVFIAFLSDIQILRL